MQLNIDNRETLKAAKSSLCIVHRAKASSSKEKKKLKIYPQHKTKEKKQVDRLNYFFADIIFTFFILLHLAGGVPHTVQLSFLKIPSLC